MEWSVFCEFKTWKITDDVLKARLMKQIRMWWNVSQNTKYFPGPQPVSIERKDFAVLRTNDYWVSYKSDGLRYIMVFVKVDMNNYCIMINRKMDMYLLRVRTANVVFDGTVLDGELVRTHDNRYEYVVYDATIVCGRSVIDQPLSARLEAAVTVCAHMQRSDIPMHVKMFYPLRDFEDYVKHVVSEINHKIDGYIFTPEHCSVSSGTNYKMFKWKEQMKNTVDFHVEYHRRQQRYMLRLSKGHSLIETQDTLAHVDRLLATLIKRGPCIVECRYVGPSEWTPVLIREDKAHPNNYLTYTKTMYNIDENIQMEEFMK
jgi:hypothetical protein